MRTPALLIACVAFAVAASFVPAQVLSYGAPSPMGFGSTLSSGGQLPYIGNPGFRLELGGVPNNFGAVIALSPASASIPVGQLLLLVDPTSWLLFNLPAGTIFPTPLPNLPSLVGQTVFAQAAVGDPAILGGFGLSNGLSITFLPDASPTRAYFVGQDFSGGAVSGQLSVMDLTTVPPSFRATGSIGFAGNIANNFSPKVAVARNAGIAYVLGNGTTNQFIRTFDMNADPTGIVTWPSFGNIPIARDIASSVGARDMEVREDNTLLFVTSGASSSSAAVVLDVFDISQVPIVPPTSPVQSITFPSAGGGDAGLSLSPDGSRLALILGADNNPALTLYSVTSGSAAPLTSLGTFPLAGTSGSGSPNDVHFSPDGSLLFVSSGSGVFSVINLRATPPSLVLDGVAWTPNGSPSFHGSALGVRSGSLVAVLGEPQQSGSPQYHVLDLNPTSTGFGTVISSISTVTGGNLSNHRSHGRQGMIVAIDGTGATVNCQFIDVINLNAPTPGGFTSFRVQIPNWSSLTPTGLSCIPRDFDMH